MYYLSVERSGKEIIRRMGFQDYAEAVNFTAQFYAPKAPRAVLSFVTEVVNGEFARSFAVLTRPDEVAEGEAWFIERRNAAVKQANAFEYDASYQFLIESELGVQDADADAPDMGG
jgi:hypothetical protein